MKARGGQHFGVCQHELANLSLPCEGRLRPGADMSRTQLWVITEWMANKVNNGQRVRRKAKSHQVRRRDIKTQQ